MLKVIPMMYLLVGFYLIAPHGFLWAFCDCKEALIVFLMLVLVMVTLASLSACIIYLISQQEDGHFNSPLFQCYYDIWRLSQCYKLKHGFCYIYSLYEGVVLWPFETGTKALRMFIIIYLILFHVMVSLASLMKVSSTSFFSPGKINWYWLGLLYLKFFYFLLQAGGTIKVVTWGISLLEGILHHGGIHLWEMQEADKCFVVRYNVLQSPHFPHFLYFFLFFICA